MFSPRVACLWLLAFAVAILASPAGRSQDEEAAPSARVESYLFQRFGKELGLPSTTATSVIQTKDGYLWVGTQSGLSRFDGVRFVSFRDGKTRAFRSHSIRRLREAPDGTLWIATQSGVVRHRDGIFTHMGLGDSIVADLDLDSKGVVWAGTYGKGIFSLHGTEWKHHPRVTELGSPQTVCVYVDSQDRVWISAQRHNGTVCIDGNTYRWSDGNGVLNDRVQSICELPRGTMWFGTRARGLFRLRDGEYRRYASDVGLRDAPVDVKPARDGTLWALTGPLQRVIDGPTVRVETISRGPHEHFTSVCEDHEGNIWIGAGGESVLRARPTPFQLISADARFAAGGVRTVTQDHEGHLWFLSGDRRITRSAPDGALSAIPLPEKATSEANAILVTRDGRVWLVSGGVYVWQDGQWLRQFDTIKTAYALYEDRDGGLWISSVGQSVHRVVNGKPVALRMSNNLLFPNTTTSFAQGRDGTMYFGTWQAGIIAWKEGKTLSYNRSSGLPADEVRALYFDREERLWAGVKGRGLCLLENGRWLNPDGISEATSDAVSAIIEDDNGRFWLGTPDGVLSAPKEDLLAAMRGQKPVSSIRLATIGDSSQPTPVASGPQPIVWKTPENKFLFASRDGVLVIDPRRLPGVAAPPQVHVERVLVDQQPIAARPGHALRPGTRDVAFEYTALSFSQPSRVLFRFMLEGHDPEWIEAGTRRTAFYSRLAPGAYTFRVQACNGDGVWNTVGASLAVRQLPYFHQTRLFWFVSSAGLLVAVLGIHIWRTRSLRRQNEQLEGGIAERTRELALANQAILARSRELELASTAKSEFLETVSHEIRNPLTGLNGLLGLLQAEKLDARAKEVAANVQACARGLTHVFEQVLGHARIEHGGFKSEVVAFELRPLVTELADSFAWQASQQGNAISVHFADDFVDGFEGDAAKIKIILSNFILNALRYAPGTPIDVEVDSQPAEDGSVEIDIEVRDQGPGIPASEQELIFKKFVRGSAAANNRVAGTGLGLAMCRVLASSMKGNVGVESQPGQGANFYLSVPLKTSAKSQLIAEDASPATRDGAALVVEDDPFNQIVLRGLAVELGYECEIASNATQAAECLARRPFQVVFLDWELPGLKGDEIARQIRQSSDGARPIIIATSAHDGTTIRDAFTAAGIDDFLPKPYDAEKVRACLGRAKTRRHTTPPLSVNAREFPSPPSAAGAREPRGLELHALGSSGSLEASRAAFHDSLGRELAELASAIAADHFERTAHSAHRLRGLAGLVGHTELTAAVQSLERLLRQGQKPEREKVFAEIERLARTL